MTARIWLIGESNPYGGDDYYALYPDPPGCAGWRLCYPILGMTEETYLASFERRNLLRGSSWSVPRAREAANALLAEHPQGDALVLLGAKVSAAFNVDYKSNVLAPLGCVQVGVGDVLRGREVLVLPHPSGRCIAWNDPDAAPRARMLVRELLRMKEATT